MRPRVPAAQSPRTSTLKRSQRAASHTRLIASASSEREGSDPAPAAGPLALAFPLPFPVAAAAALSAAFFAATVALRLTSAAACAADHSS